MRYIISLLVIFLLSSSLCYSEGLPREEFVEVVTKYVVSQAHIDVLWAIAEVETRQGEDIGETPVYQYFSDKYDETGKRSYALHRIALEKLKRHYNIDVEVIKGSHAGAMGYMQVMPSTFYAYKQDGDGDGIKDPMNPYDSLATAAYYFTRNYTAELERLSNKSAALRKALRKYNNSTKYVNKILLLSKKY